VQVDIVQIDQRIRDHVAQHIAFRNRSGMADPQRRGDIKQVIVTQGHRTDQDRPRNLDVITGQFLHGLRRDPPQRRQPLCNLLPDFGLNHVGKAHQHHVIDAQLLDRAGFRRQRKQTCYVSHKFRPLLYSIGTLNRIEIHQLGLNFRNTHSVPSKSVSTIMF